MRKVFWFDVETTGLSPYKHDIIELACLIEIDGEVKKVRELKLAPLTPQTADAAALSLNKVTIEELMAYPDSRKQLDSLIDTLSEFVNPYKSDDKFIFAGYNVSFDIDFLRSAWKKNKLEYFGSFFFSPPLDIFCFVAEEVANGLRLKNYKLGTLCEHYGIQIKAHTAISDILATRELYYRLKGNNEPDTSL